MDKLVDLGIFFAGLFGGLGVFFFGCASCWWCSIYNKQVKSPKQ